MGGLNGLSFGNVWNYGNLDAFKADFKKTAQERQVKPQELQVKPQKPEEPQKKAPPDVGLSRYLGSSGNAELKFANLMHIDTEVRKLKLKEGALPENRQKSADLVGDDVCKRLFPGNDYETSVKTLARMLEKKLPSETKDDKSFVNLCKRSLDKTLDAAARLQTKAGLGAMTEKERGVLRDVLLNSALGVAELLARGLIDEDSVITLMQDGGLYDLSNDLDVTRLLKQSAERAKEEFVGEKAINAALQTLKDKCKSGAITLDDFNGSAEKLTKLLEARKRFARVLDFGITGSDPDKKLDSATFLKRQLQDAKLRLQQFRYDLERCIGDVGKEFGHGRFGFYGIMEKIRRSCSNWTGNRHLDSRFQTNIARNAAFRELMKAESDAKELLSGSGSDNVSVAKEVRRRARAACAITHEANNGARLNQADAERRRAWSDYGNAVLERLRENGGMKEVATEVSVSALLDFGSDLLASGRASVGGFVKTLASVSAHAMGGYKLTLAKGGGAKVGVKVSGPKDGLDVDVGAHGKVGEKTIITFENQEELITFCRRHAPKLLESISGAPKPDAPEGEGKKGSSPMDRLKAVKETGEAVMEKIRRAKEVLEKHQRKAAKIGKFLGNLTGVRIHKTKNFNEILYDQKLHDTHVMGDLDVLLVERKNARANEVTKLKEVAFGGNAGGKVGSTDGKPKVGGSVGVKGTFGFDGKTKRLLAAQTVFKWHTAEELMQNVRTTQEAIANWVKGKSLGAGEREYAKWELAFRNEATKLLEPKRDSSGDAAFWLERAGKMKELVDRHERAYAALGSASGFCNELFARTTGYLATVNECLAKSVQERIDGFKGAEQDKKDMLRALGEFRKVVGGVLDRPRPEIPYAVFQQHVQFGAQLESGNVKETQIGFEVEWNASSKGRSDGLVNMFLTPALDAYKRIVQAGVGENQSNGRLRSFDLRSLDAGGVTGNMTVLLRQGKSEVIQPWKKTDSLQFDLSLKRSVSPASVLASACRLCGLAMEREPANDGLRATMTLAMNKLAEELGLVAVGEAVVGSGRAFPTGARETPGKLGELFKTLGVSLSKTESGVRDEGTKLTLRFEDDAFSLFKVSDFVSRTKATDLHLAVAKSPFDVKVGRQKSDREEFTTVEIMTAPSLTTLLGRCDDVLSANGDKGDAELENFLRSQQVAVNNLVRSLRNDPLADKAIKTLNDGLLKVKVSTKLPLELRKAAKAALDGLSGEKGILERLRSAPDSANADGERLALVKELATRLIAGYGILSDAQLESKSVLLRTRFGMIIP